MNEEYGESSTNDSEKEDERTNRNENVSKDKRGYQKVDAFVPDKLDYKAISENYEIEPSKLKIMDAIGEGYYSDVHMGMLSSPTAEIPVAVKTIKRKTGAINAEESEDIRKSQRQALREELRIFAHLQSSSTGGHENVLKLLGAITTIRTDFCLLTEYCECGSMDRFLQAKWKNGHFVDELVIEANENEQVWKILRDSKWGEDFQSRREKGLITTSDLLWFALQIARGMEFLAAKNILHRDSAVRNVLLKLDYTLKVADFGLLRKLKDDEEKYYIWKRNTAIPILYIAPESLKSRRFEITSELWSFGVVVWELFTFAEKKPYSELDHYENNEPFYEFLVQHLSCGRRLLIPNNVPRQIKSLLSRLWHSDPKKRPSFQVCKKVIRQDLMQSCPNILLKVTDVTDYSEYSIDHGEKEEECVSPKEKLLVDNDEYQKDDALIRERLDYKAIDGKFEIEPDTLTIVKAIWKGNFSDVHMGILTLPSGDTPVAVKMQQMKTGAMNVVDCDDIVKFQRQALREELHIFAHLQSSSTGGHENVLKLLGAITTISTDFCLLTEYCECGSLNRFLRAKWRNDNYEDELVFEGNKNKEVWKIQRDSNWGKNFQFRRENGKITTSDLMWFALQIARGMQFLANMNIIHGDIALRNVLLNSDFTLKVANFGLSRKLEGSDDGYYMMKVGTAIPILYIAPESLKFRRFARSSEFWSFGVVVWELFTFAEKQPYSVEFEIYENNVHFVEFLVKRLSSGHRLSIPDVCPQQIKSLLSRLWHSDPKQRPSFQECRKVIRQELMQSCPNMLLKEEAPHHASAYSLLRLDAEEVNERTSESLNSTPLESGTSAQPSRENQQPVNHEVRVRRKVDRRIVVSVGFLALVLVAMLTALGFILLYALLLESKNVTSSSDSTFAEVANALQNTNTAIWYRKAAEQGNVAAQLNLGLMYEQGSGVPQSDEEAVEWYRKAAENGNAIAQSNLGNMYRNGRGVTQSNEKAEKWLRKAAERGHASAQYNLGVIYSSGQSVSYSDEEAVKWFRMAAEQGVAGAQNSLGIMYQNGRGVPKSDEEAVEWYNKAAERGYANAQNILGVMYCRGQGVNQSYEDAVKWFRKAAEQGDINSQYNLGIMYSKGQGVLPSNVDAAYWFSKAKEQGKAEIQHNVRLIHDEA